MEESWQVLAIRGQRIGYSHGTSREEIREGRTVIITDAVTNMSIVRLGQRLTVRQVLHLEETETGELLRVSTRMDNPPHSSTSSHGTVAGNSLTWVTTTAGKEARRVIEHDVPILSPGYLERYLASPGLAVGESATFTVFEAELGQMSNVTIQRSEDRETELWGGRKRVLRSFTMNHSVLPGIHMSLFTDDEGVVQKTTMPLLGVESFTVTEEEALKELEGEPLDLALETLIPVAIPQDPHRARYAVYQLALDGADPTPLLATGITQSLEPIGGDRVRVHVRSVRPPAAVAAADSPGEEYLASTRFVAWRDPLIQKLADEGDGDHTDPSQIALALESFVRRTVTSKNFSTSMATASEVAQSRSGDCTEHAVLLAALLRAKGIPSRAAIGMVYAHSEPAFVGHMWTEAWLGGEWIPLDATLGQGGIGVGHIKVSDSSLADEGTFPLTGFIPLLHLVGRLKIELISME